ncbi:MAG: response regulator transcription factor [Gammaproteobacteria bacterium]|nr:response regulator transcription factor [Gammaproteobacteria bacterium]
MHNNILLIDDDAKLGDLLSDYFMQFNFVLTCVQNPLQALSLLSHSTYDFIILDVMLPEMDGFETLKMIRTKYDTPVIMLTARGDTTDRIVGLELGADDYLPKPFEPRELVARINRIVKRARMPVTRANLATFTDISIDFDKGLVALNDEEIILSASEFDILSILARQPEKVFTRDDLFDALKGHDWDAFNRSIDVTISRLRQKLHDNPKKPRFIKTIFGRGYQFIAQLVE